jgi:hypothetical protein
MGNSGKIIKIAGGKIIERAKGDIIYDSGGDIINTAGGKIIQNGKEGGVVYGDYEPPLEVLKIDGPFDDKGKKVSVVKKGIFYTYKVVQFSRELKEDELKKLRWATQFDKQGIFWDYTQSRGKKSARFAVPHQIDTSSFTVYAYINMSYAGMNSSYIKTGVDKFYYKGVKSWGKLQKYDEKGQLDFSAKNYQVTEKELKANLDDIGRQNVEILKGYGERWVKWFYEYAAGTRQVLSDDDDIENKVVNNFYTGKLSKLSFDENSKQSKKLHDYKPFQQYFKNYLEVIKILLKERTITQKDGKEIANIFVKILNLSDFKPNFSIISDIYSYDYYGFMGGTQTIKVEIEIEEKEAGKYWVETKMYIGDWYGADWQDINGGSLQDFIKQIDIDWSNPLESLKKIKDLGKKYFKEHIKGNTPSLNAFFWLQHYYGCHPFETEIIYKDTNYIQL